jgi:hypothetical protein
MMMTSKELRALPTVNCCKGLHRKLIIMVCGGVGISISLSFTPTTTTKREETHLQREGCGKRKGILWQWHNIGSLLIVKPQQLETFWS